MKREMTTLRDLRRRRRSGFEMLVAVMLCGALCPVPASARRAATQAESGAMWRAAEPRLGEDCVHHRGVISTVKQGRYLYGYVTVRDNVCGNGDIVVRKRRTGAQWSWVTSGSDIGVPDRCAADLKKIPTAVFRDLFPRNPYCPTAPRNWKACQALTVETGSGVSTYRIFSLRAGDISCARARAVVRDFYSKPIGSSGANEALGYGCAYGRGRRVSCRVRTANTYSGPFRVRWRERDA